MVTIKWTKIANVETNFFHLDGRSKTVSVGEKKGFYRTGSNFVLYDVGKKVISAAISTNSGVLLLKKAQFGKLGSELPLLGTMLVIEEKNDIYFAKITKVLS